ncbi:MAG: DnaD domain protein [Acholeplasmatales bacterium]|nr:DnaD domain protein [Acholeplasmatales bacterium]
MDKTFNADSKFNIVSNFNLATDDLSTLTLLYAPLMGSDAYLLYMSFQALLERNNLKSETLTHKEFFKIYSLKTNDFIKARLKLEGIGLLITYLDENNDYLYIVCPPMTPRNFLKDATLGLYLYAKIEDEEAFKNLYSHFKIEKIDKNNYKNITKSFDEVFQSRIDNEITYNKFSYILGRKGNVNIKITHSDFKIDYFIKNIDTKFLETGVTSNFKQQIINLAFVYNFDEAEMISLFNDSINKSGYYDYRLLKRNANTLFKYKKNMSAPVLEEKNNDTVTNDNLVSWLENVSPEELLSSCSNYSENTLNTVLEIYNNIDLPRGVLNAMIMKAIKDKEGDLPSFKYFEKMATTWIKDGVFSTIDAVKYSTSLREETGSSSNTNNKDEGGFDEL